MPGPPTPLSGCLLKRLEIIHHLLSNHEVYDASHMAHALTLTLEAERSIKADTQSLMLQAHYGLERVVCLS